jgi:hypothetical protein
MRIIPDLKYDGLPCSYVGTGCAYEDYFKKPFNEKLPDGLKSNGYLSLNSANKYLRSLLPVRKRVYFKGGTRPLLKDFLRDNKEKCCICVYGHFIYANGNDYWSFFENGDDEIVCIWYLKQDN